MLKPLNEGTTKKVEKGISKTPSNQSIRPITPPNNPKPKMGGYTRKFKEQEGSFNLRIIRKNFLYCL